MTIEELLEEIQKTIPMTDMREKLLSDRLATINYKIAEHQKQISILRAEEVQIKNELSKKNTRE